MAVEVVSSGLPVGAEIRGIDLAGEVSDADFQRIQDALNRHAMVFLRRQVGFLPQKQVEFTRRFGPLQKSSGSGPYRSAQAPDVLLLSNILEDGRHIGVIEAGQYWHSDLPFTTNPPKYACLHAIEIPRDQDGNTLGGTMFAGTNYGYETLDEKLRARISGLRALQSQGTRNMSEARRKLATEFDTFAAGRETPVVRTHPVTGKKCLYVNPTYTDRILGVAKEEGAELLDTLCRHITRPELVYTHHWEVDDVVIWDDCGLQHHAKADYALPHRRLIYRTTVEGATPF